MLVSRDRGVTWEGLGGRFPFTADGFTYSASEDAVYIWQKYCDFQAGVNVVLDDAIFRLDADLTP